MIYPKYSEKNVFCTQSQTEKYSNRYEKNISIEREVKVKVAHSIE
jgi:hypothetical protein